LLNAVVTNLLNPFLAPAPNAPEPITPVVWAVLGWVRRNLFNQSPTIKYDPTTTAQTGQTVTGYIGATDPENDALTYTVTQQPQNGKVTIDQATGKFTYTPNDINYDAAQTDSFIVSVTDGKQTNLLGLFQPRSASTDVDITVLNPTVQRVILSLPAGMNNAATPRFSADGQSILFAATPPAGGREEIYQIGVDGMNLECVTCGVSTNITANLFKPVPFQDDSGRVLVQTVQSNGSYTNAVLEDGPNGKVLVPVISPTPNAETVIDPQREMRPSPDGTHVLFSQMVVGQGGTITAITVVGTLTRTTNATTGTPEYHVDDARVVYGNGEGKQWTPDGKGVIVLGGTYEAGNVDDVEVDLATGNVTDNPEYDEDIDLSPNEQWIAVGSTRTLDALSPMDRIERPAFLPAYVQGTVYTAYAGTSNVKKCDEPGVGCRRRGRTHRRRKRDPAVRRRRRLCRPQHAQLEWGRDRGHVLGGQQRGWQSQPNRRRQPEVHDQRRTGGRRHVHPQPELGAETQHLRGHQSASAGYRNVRGPRRRHRGGQRGPGCGRSYDPHRQLHRLRQRRRNDPERHRINRHHRQSGLHPLRRRHHRHRNAHRLPGR